MTLPLPACARCGETLRYCTAHRSRVVCQHIGLDGNPSVGWHNACVELDPAWQRLRDAPHHERPGILREIEARGPGRVIPPRTIERTP